MKTLRFLSLLILISVAKNGVTQESWYPHFVFINNSPPNLNSVFYYQTFFGLTCGDNGNIGFYSRMIGKSWLHWYPNLTTKNLYGTYIVDSLNIKKGYIVGESGIIMKTNSINYPQLSFYIQNSPTTNDLNAICFPLYSNGIAVGKNGTIVRTTDGGSHWVIINSGTSNSLYSVHFPVTNTGYASGTNGTVLKTTDNGQNWQAKTQPVNDTLRSLWFTNENTGFVVSRNGAIFKTTDGGNSWQSRISGTSQNLYAVCFSTNIKGYAAGNNNIISRTTNGGENWSAFSPPVFNSGHFRGLAVGVVNSNEVLVVGTNRTASGTISDWGDIKENNVSQSFSIYPLPASDKITISTTGSLQKESLVSIYNIQGELLLSNTFALQNPVEMDVSSLARGVYIVKIQSGEAKEVKKLVIQ